MSFSITNALYDWMHEKRIVTAVAQAMGMKDSTLAAQLRPASLGHKLGADDLIQLCEAIRKIGYGRELQGILLQYHQALDEGTAVDPGDADLVPHVLKLVQTLGVISECAAKIPTITDEDELTKLCTMLRTEILPVVLQMESAIVTRLKTIRKRKRESIFEPLNNLIPKPAQASGEKQHGR
jgi:hypothetical protein